MLTLTVYTVDTIQDIQKAWNEAAASPSERDLQPPSRDRGKDSEQGQRTVSSGRSGEQALKGTH